MITKKEDIQRFCTLLATLNALLTLSLTSPAQAINSDIAIEHESSPLSKPCEKRKAEVAIYWKEAPKAVYDTVQQVIHDPSLAIEITNKPDHIAFSGGTEEGNRGIAYHEDFVKAIERHHEEPPMLDPATFKTIIEKRHLDEDDMVTLLRSTLVLKEWIALTLHEYGHLVNRHGTSLAGTYSKKELCDINEKRECEADDYAIKHASPDILLALENDLNKMCIVDQYRFKKYNSHGGIASDYEPLSCKRAIRVTKSMMNP